MEKIKKKKLFYDPSRGHDIIHRVAAHRCPSSVRAYKKHGEKKKSSVDETRVLLYYLHYART